MHPRTINKKISYDKHALQARSLMKQNAPQARLMNQNAFVTKSSWVLCPVNAVCNLFSTNHGSESSSLIN